MNTFSFWLLFIMLFGDICASLLYGLTEQTPKKLSRKKYGCKFIVTTILLIYVIANK